MANGLLDLLGGLGTTPPSYMEGLLGQQATEDLRKRSIGTGLANALVGYLAMPKNQQLGLGRILAGTAQAGMQGAQNVYEGATKDYLQAQQIAEAQRKIDQQKRLQTMLGGITDPNERLAAEIAPEQYVAAKFKPKTARETVIAPNGQLIYKDTGELVTTQSFAAPEKVALTELDKLIEKRNDIYNKNPNDPILKIYDAKIKKETEPSAGVTVNYGAPVAGVDAQGNPVFFQPAKGGGAPSIVSGVTPPPKEEKQQTEAQAKASAFANQMKSATGEISRLEGEGYNPTSPATQATTSLAGTPLTFLASPEAQQANQAQQQWAEAYLRFKTGAAATEGEVKRNMRTFFPQIGDSPKTVDQKARMRLKAEQDVANAGKQPSEIKSNVAPKLRSKADILKQYGL